MVSRAGGEGLDKSELLVASRAANDPAFLLAPKLILATATASETHEDWRKASQWSTHLMDDF